MPDNDSRQVRSAMSDNLVTCSPNTPVTDVARLMADHDIGDVLVVDGAELIGIVTDRDIVVRGLAGGPRPLTAADVMTEDLCTVEAAAPLTAAAELMGQKAIRRLPVLDEGRLVGIISLGALAEDHAPHTVLGAISDAAPNN